MTSWKTDDNVRHARDENATFGGRSQQTVTQRAISMCGIDIWLARKTENPVDCMTCLVKEANHGAA